MSSNPYAQFNGVPMSEEAVDDLLRDRGWGIVSLCRDGDPYSIPISFGFDGERIFFAFLEDSPDPLKMDFIEDGSAVRLLVADVRGRFDWRSVAVDGTARGVAREGEDWEHMIDTLEDNGWFMGAFERSDAVESIQGWELEVDERRGLERTEEVYE